MLAFDVLFPELARQESRAITVSGDDQLPDGTYLFRENYCTEQDCNCRRVLIQVFHGERPQQVATINYGFEPPRPPHEDEGQVFLDPLNPQSGKSEALLALFSSMVDTDSTYRSRLIRHYDMWKRVVDDPSHPDQAILQRLPSYVPKRTPFTRAGPKIGANDPCPCGSGRKFKKCCVHRI